MCLIIHKPENSTIPKWVIDSAKEYNSDGVGLMGAGDASRWLKIKTNKVYDKANKLKNCALHFRMATHGTRGIENCHPFKLAGGDHHLMHNGIFRNYTPKKGHELDSDTATFVKEYIDPELQETGTIDLHSLESAISGNAVAIQHPSKRITRHGSGWLEYDGCHYSNDYAWDYPDKWQPKKYNYDAYRSDFLIDNYELSGSRSSHYYTSTDAMIDDYLLSCMWDLPLDSDTYIDDRDVGLYDKVWRYQLEIEDFLDQCSPETKVKLFAWLIEHNYV